MTPITALSFDTVTGGTGIIDIRATGGVPAGRSSGATPASLPATPAGGVAGLQQFEMTLAGVLQQLLNRPGSAASLPDPATDTAATPPAGTAGLGMGTALLPFQLAQTLDGTAPNQFAALIPDAETIS